MKPTYSKKSKYGNRKITIDGITFDSVREGNRYRELKLLERAGEISNLRLQEPFVLIPTQYSNGKPPKLLERACVYRADFFYIEGGKAVVEDCKGFKTEAYIIKRKLMLQNYGIKIRET